MLSMVKMPLKGAVGGHALNSHGNYIVDHGKTRNFCGNPGIFLQTVYDPDEADKTSGLIWIQTVLPVHSGISEKSFQKS